MRKIVDIFFQLSYNMSYVKGLWIILSVGGANFSATDSVNVTKTLAAAGTARIGLTALVSILAEARGCVNVKDRDQRPL